MVKAETKTITHNDFGIIVYVTYDSNYLTPTFLCGFNFNLV